MASTSQEPCQWLQPSKFALSITQEAVERDWAARGFRLEVLVQLAGALLGRSTEKRDELVVVVRGALEVALGEEGQGQRKPAVCRVSPGDELLIPRLTSFEARVVGEGECEFYVGFG